MNVRVSLNTSRNGSDDEIEKIYEGLQESLGIFEIVGIDPGFTDVVTGSSDERTFHYSSKLYYERAKVNYSRRRTTKWNNETEKLSNSLGKNGGRTTSDELMGEYVKSYLSVLSNLLYHRLAKGYRKMRFLRFIYKKKTVKEICDLIAPVGKTVLVGFGNWSGGHNSCISRKNAGLRGLLPPKWGGRSSLLPIQDIKQELRSRKNVFFKHIDEHKTSKNDSKTFLELTNMKAKTTIVFRDGTRKTTMNKVHKVLHCKTSDGKRPDGCRETTCNRDVNASINILTLFKLEIAGQERPSVFCRATKQ